MRLRFPVATKETQSPWFLNFALYELHPDRPMRPPWASGLSIGDLLAMLIDHARADADDAPQRSRLAGSRRPSDLRAPLGD